MWHLRRSTGGTLHSRLGTRVGRFAADRASKSIGISTSAGRRLHMGVPTFHAGRNRIKEYTCLSFLPMQPLEMLYWLWSFSVQKKQVLCFGGFHRKTPIRSVVRSGTISPDCRSVFSLLGQSFIIWEENMAKLASIEGIGTAYEGKLAAAGVQSVEELLKTGSTPAGRKALEEKTGISHDLLLEWINHADLYRIPGIGEEYSDLLEEAGVDTVAELAQRNSDNLFNKLVEVNQAKELVRRLPSQKQVADWVECAKSLPKVITY